MTDAASTFRIERLGPDDHLRAKAIRLRALREAPDVFWVTAEEEERTTPEQWRERLSGPNAVTFVARLGNADIGLVVGAQHRRQEEDAGLYAMWVAPEARRSGVAGALVGVVVEWAREQGFDSLRLEVTDENEPARRLYEAMGFRPTGVVGRFLAPREHIREHELALDLRT